MCWSKITKGKKSVVVVISSDSYDAFLNPLVPCSRYHRVVVCWRRGLGTARRYFNPNVPSLYLLHICEPSSPSLVDTVHSQEDRQHTVARAPPFVLARRPSAVARTTLLLLLLPRLRHPAVTLASALVHCERVNSGATADVPQTRDFLFGDIQRRLAPLVAPEQGTSRRVRLVPEDQKRWTLC